MNKTLHAQCWRTALFIVVLLHGLLKSPLTDPGVLFQFPEDFSDEVNFRWPQITKFKQNTLELRMWWWRLRQEVRANLWDLGQLAFLGLFFFSCLTWSFYPKIVDFDLMVKWVVMLGVSEMNASHINPNLRFGIWRESYLTHLDHLHSFWVDFYVGAYVGNFSIKLASWPWRHRPETWLAIATQVYWLTVDSSCYVGLLSLSPTIKDR